MSMLTTPSTWPLAIVEETLTAGEYVSLLLILILYIYIYEIWIITWQPALFLKKQRKNWQPEKIMQVKRSNAPFFYYSSSDSVNCHSKQGTIK